MDYYLNRPVDLGTVALMSLVFPVVGVGVAFAFHWVVAAWVVLGCGALWLIVGCVRWVIGGPAMAGGLDRELRVAARRAARHPQGG